MWIAGTATLTAAIWGLSLLAGRTVDTRHTRAGAGREAAQSPEPSNSVQEAPILAAANERLLQRPPEAATLAQDRADPVEDEARRSAAEQAQLARLPLLTAIRGDYASQQARYDAMRGALERSGPTSELWAREASQVFASWTRALGQAAGEAEPGSLRCFVAGCEMRVAFRDDASAERAAVAFRMLQEETSTHGGRVQTPAVRAPEGGAQVIWIMLRPDVMPPTAAGE
jgi:hypothetical protein